MLRVGKVWVDPLLATEMDEREEGKEGGLFPCFSFNYSVALYLIKRCEKEGRDKHERG